ncbi:hypothetical protein AGMMS49944_22180 [Spirochaetia bacterium]|nr:hypothetical protein AGMMS49944_22180 [Spirochaetia bacterium]
MKEPEVKLIEQNDSSKLTFKSEVNSLEFTANIDNVQFIDQKERDEKLAEIGKQISITYSSPKKKKPKLFEIRFFRTSISQEEIDDLLPMLGIHETAFQKLKKRIKYFFNSKWRINMEINGNPIGFPRRKPKSGCVLSDEEVSQLIEELKKEESNGDAYGKN